MTCWSARRRMADLFDGAEASGELRAHLDTCAACAARLAGARTALAAVEPPQKVRASANFQERTMRRLARELASKRAPRPGFRTTPLLRFAWMAGAVSIVVLMLPYLGTLGTNRGAVTLLAQSVQAMSELRSVHILAQMRTHRGDNFEFIGAEYDFQPVEMWKEFGAMPRWRMENPGRVVVMDGTRSTLFIKPDQVVHGGRNAGFIEWLRPLLDPEQVLSSELRAAQKGDSHAAIQREGARVTLTTSRKAKGEYVNNWGRNTSVSDSDHTRVYRFDAATSRLTGLQVILHDGARDVVVFEIAEIRYNEPLSPELFNVTLPDGVISYVPPAQMPVGRPLPATARDAAVMFFEGLAQRDWEQVLMVYPKTAVPKNIRRYGGLQVISIGEPFQSGLWAGWYVPYEVVLPDGTHKKWNLAVRNDNPARRWIWDGGL